MASKYVGLMIIPALAFLVTVIIGQYRGDPIVHSPNLESVGRWISTYVIEVLPLFWPLLILRIAIGTQFVKRLPNATARNRAALCALISLSIPYVFAFAYLPLLIVAAPRTGHGYLACAGRHTNCWRISFRWMENRITIFRIVKTGSRAKKTTWRPNLAARRALVGGPAPH
jgi:hypothetical protein